MVNLAIAVTEFKQGRDAVIIEPASRSHMPRFYTESLRLSRYARRAQAGPEDIIQHFAKWQPSQTDFSPQ